MVVHKYDSDKIRHRCGWVAKNLCLMKRCTTKWRGVTCKNCLASKHRRD